MLGNSRTPIGEHRRKRVRKGTRSCWECKRRKVKCTFQSANNSVCVGCVDKGTPCLSQEYVDVQSPPNAGNSALDQRMERVENLIEKFIEKISQSTQGKGAVSAPEDVFTPSSTPAGLRYSNETLGHQVYSNISVPTSQPVAIPNFAINTNDITTTGVETLRQRLAAMLPCQYDIEYLWDSSHGWWLLRKHMMPNLLRMPEQELRKELDVLTVSKAHPMIIARLLLCLALCIQQLPPNIDLRRVQSRVPLRDLMENYINFVSTRVTSDDELTGTQEGIQCLALQGIYHVNAGNLRRAWITFRRAISVAQLMGLHRVSLETSQEASDSTETQRHSLWYPLMKSERYLSLILGVPSATGSASSPLIENTSSLSTEDFYHRNLCHIAGLILARNQGDSTRSLSTSLEIDEKLEYLAKSMSQTWWDIPAAVIRGRNNEAAIQFERMMCQIWHFELGTLIHLPFMLSAAADQRYEYSRISCLNASRGLIRRWLFIRQIPDATMLSILIEFQAFTAAITILLGLLGTTRNTTDQVIKQQHNNDMHLVETVVETLERLQRFGTAVNVAKQSISVIRTLQGLIRNEDNSSGSLRLEIPYFGTIMVARSGAVQSLEGERILGANPRPGPKSMGVISTHMGGCSNPSTTASGLAQTSLSAPRSHGYQSMDFGGAFSELNGLEADNTMLQFTSSQFPTFEIPGVNNMTDWQFEESDTIFFDSLLNTDLEGNWNF